MTTIPAGARIGDYVIESALTAVPTELAFAATHVLLPRRARIVVAAHHDAAIDVMRRACLIEALQHPAVPRVYECGLLPDRRPWVAVEIVEGDTLLDFTVLPPAETIVLLRDIAAVLEYAHGRGVTHGGLRSELIVRAHGTLRIASWASASTTTSSAVDIHALAAIVYFAMTRSLPVVPVARRCPGAPSRLSSLLDRMLDPNPAARPTAADVRIEVDLLLERIDPVVRQDDGVAIEEVEVELVEIPYEPPPPRSAKLKWTPPNAYMPPPPALPANVNRKKSP